MVKVESNNSSEKINKVKNEPSAAMLSNLDLKLLRVYKSIVEAGGFTAASIELNVGLATISKQISDLEVRLGLTLCSRGRDGFELTEYGIKVYEATNELLNSMEIFREKLYSTRRDILGDMVIYVVDNTITDPESPIIGAIKNLHNTAPKLNIRLQVSQPEEIERAVNDGRVHCGISPIYSKKEEFEYLYLYSEKIKLYCSYTHELSKMQSLNSVRQEDVASYKIVQHLTIPHTHQQRVTSNSEFRVQAVSVESVAMLILTGEFIGYLPVHYADQFINKDKLVSIGEEENTITMDMYLFIKKGRSSSPMIKKFIASIHDTKS